MNGRRRRIVVHAAFLGERVARNGRELKPQASVGQRTVHMIEELVDRAGEYDPVERLGCRDFGEFGAHANIDQRVVEHALEEPRIAVCGHLLERVLKIAVVARQMHRHSRRHRRIEFRWGKAPLFGRVVQEDLLVYSVGHRSDLSIRRGGHLQDGNLDLGSVLVGQQFVEASAFSAAERDFGGGEIEWHRD